MYSLLVIAMLDMIAVEQVLIIFKVKILVSVVKIPLKVRVPVIVIKLDPTSDSKFVCMLRVLVNGLKVRQEPSRQAAVAVYAYVNVPHPSGVVVQGEKV